MNDQSAAAPPSPTDGPSPAPDPATVAFPWLHPRWRAGGEAVRARLRRRLAAWTVAGVVSSAVALAAPGFKPAWIVANLVLFHLAGVLVILPHELGHALVARCCGSRVFLIVVGAFGGPVFEGRIGGVRVVFNSIPYGGYTFVVPTARRALRAVEAATILAGPLVSALLLLVVWPGLPSFAACLDAASTGFAPLIMFAAANAATLLANLIPRSRRGPDGVRVGNDGFQLLRALRGNTAPNARMDAVRASCEGTERVEAKDYAGARRWYEAGFAADPTFPGCAFGLAGLHAIGERWEEACEGYRSIVAMPGLNETSSVRALNHLAWCSLMAGTAASLAEADARSADAFRRAPWAPLVTGTRGAVLIETGRIDEGMRLLAVAFEGNEHPKMKALNACGLALGECLRGRRDAALAHVATARALDRDCRLLPRVEARIASAETPVSKDDEAP